MKIRSMALAAALGMQMLATAASAASVSSIDKASVGGSFAADFNVTAINVTNLNSQQSQATLENFQKALNGTLGDGNEAFVSGSFSYSGAVNFGTSDGSNTSVFDFINSGVANGGSTDLDSASSLGTATNSRANINQGTAITTFYLFEAIGNFSAGTFDIAHDDGVLVIDDNAALAGFAGPNGQRGTRVEGFDGGALSILYVSTNNDPSVLRIDTNATAAVPLPAAAWMLLAGLGAIGAVSRRRSQA